MQVGPHVSAAIQQSGQYNAAMVGQIGQATSATVLQNGGSNNALVRQMGRLNNAIVGQSAPTTGRGVQIGPNNLAGIGQAGAYNGRSSVSGRGDRRARPAFCAVRERRAQGRGPLHAS